MSIRHATWLLPLLLCGACASVTSHVSPAGPTADGLVYYMPRKDVLVTVTLAAATPPAVAAPTIKIDASSSYGDLSQAYVASFRRNLIGKNQLTVQANEAGLLTSSKAETTSNLAEIIKEMAGAAGAVGALDMHASATPTKAACPPNATVSLRVPVDVGRGSGVHRFGDFPACSIRVTVEVLPSTVGSNGRSTRFNPRHAGFFYRQNRPHTVTVQFGPWEARDLVQLPNDAPVQFLPVERSVFANNLSELTFVDGVPTKYGQTVEGEALALAKLPAEVIKAYFGAVGNVFSQRKTALDNEQQYLTTLMLLMQKQAATEACMVAMQAKDDALIAARCK